ncbi:MAG TPA: DUF4124 domain-containing protein [Aquirhabdus sp.]
MRKIEQLTVVESNIESCMKPRFVVGIMLLSFMSVALMQSQLVNAAVYKKVDADGNVSFSDVPDKNAQLITVAPLSTVPAMSPELIESTLGNNQTSSSNVRSEDYTLTIISPAPDQTYHRGAEAFSANVQVKPELINGDRLITLINGQPSSNVQTEGMDRGQHQFEAKIVNANGRVLISKSVSFNVQQSNVKQQARMGIKH